MELDGQNNAWKKIKSVVNKKQSSMKYQILSTKSADRKIKRSITTNEKLEAFHKSLKPTFESNIDPKTFNKTLKNNIDDNVAETSILLFLLSLQMKTTYLLLISGRD